MYAETLFRIIMAILWTILFFYIRRTANKNHKNCRISIESEIKTIEDWVEGLKKEVMCNNFFSDESLTDEAINAVFKIRSMPDAQEWFKQKHFLAKDNYILGVEGLSQGSIAHINKFYNDALGLEKTLQLCQRIALLPENHAKVLQFQSATNFLEAQLKTYRNITNTPTHEALKM